MSLLFGLETHGVSVFKQKGKVFPLLLVILTVNTQEQYNVCAVYNKKPHDNTWLNVIKPRQQHMVSTLHYEWLSIN